MADRKQGAGWSSGRSGAVHRARSAVGGGIHFKLFASHH